MSVQNALKLIKVLRDEKLQEPGSFSSLEDLADVSAKYGLNCTAEELSTAFEKDWKMRWMKYRTPPVGTV